MYYKIHKYLKMLLKQNQDAKIFSCFLNIPDHLKIFHYNSGIFKK